MADVPKAALQKALDALGSDYSSSDSKDELVDHLTRALGVSSASVTMPGGVTVTRGIPPMEVEIVQEGLGISVPEGFAVGEPGLYRTGDKLIMEGPTAQQFAATGQVRILRTIDE